MTLEEQKAELAAWTETVKAREAWERDHKVPVQYLGDEDGSWFDCTSDPLWEDGTHYRLAPARKTVPLSQEDLPPQPWFRQASGGTIYPASAIRIYGVDIGPTYYTWAELQSGWLYAPSHLGPWKPCSKEIDQ